MQVDADDLKFSHMDQTPSKDEWECLLSCLGKHLGEKFR